MDPVVVTYNSEDRIELQWTPLVDPSTGNSNILSYNLLFDNGISSGAIDIELTDSLVTEFTAGGLSEGVSYSFQVRAQNVYGYGPLSDVTL
jgi:hypothetical protein